MSLGFTSRAKDDYLGQSDLRAAVEWCRSLYYQIAREHDGSTGAHLGIHIRSSGGTVSVSAGTYTLRDSYGLVSSISKVATGQVRVYLSGAGVALAPGESSYWYPVDVLIHDAIGVCRVANRTATKFDVYILDKNGAAQDAGFSFALGGLAA